MPILDDLNIAIRDYCKNSVTLSIIFNRNYDIVTPPGTQGGVNVNEVGRFRIRVINNGLLNINNVKFGIWGKNYLSTGNVTNLVKVSNISTGPFSEYYFTTTPLTVNCGSSQDSQYYYFKAPANASASAVKLLAAHIHEFDADLNHILVSHTECSPLPEAPLSEQVYP
jgi:hypothetical protein